MTHNLIEKLNSYPKESDDYSATLILINNRLNILDIIRDKNVDIYQVLHTRTYVHYNNIYLQAPMYSLSEDEYNNIKAFMQRKSLWQTTYHTYSKKH